jgi:hypothetical protein
MPDKNATTPNACTVAEQTTRAFALRVKGLSYRDIAAEMGCSVGWAYKLVSDELAKLQAESAEKAAELRQIELERLDGMLVAMREDIDKGDARKIETALKIMERRAKLLGLDAPTKQEVSGPDGGAIPIEDARSMLAERIAALAGKPDGEPAGGDSGEPA